jgi:hypothetical protein
MDKHYRQPYRRKDSGCDPSMHSPPIRRGPLAREAAVRFHLHVDSIPYTAVGEFPSPKNSVTAWLKTAGRPHMGQ